MGKGKKKKKEEEEKKKERTRGRREKEGRKAGRQAGITSKSVGRDRRIERVLRGGAGWWACSKCTL